MKTKWFCLLALTLALRLSAEPPTRVDCALKWDAASKTNTAKLGESNAPFTFVATNVSDAEVVINSLTTTCGCTVAQLPTTPYKLPPGSNVTISVAMNLIGKMGAVTKTIAVDTTAGLKTLLANVNILTDQKTETK